MLQLNSKKAKRIDLSVGSTTIPEIYRAIKWIGKKTTGSHNGVIQIEKGVLLTNKDNEIVSGKFMINMESIECTDLKGGKKEKYALVLLVDPKVTKNIKEAIIQFIFFKK